MLAVVILSHFLITVYILNIYFIITITICIPMSSVTRHQKFVIHFNKKIFWVTI